MVNNLIDISDQTILSQFEENNLKRVGSFSSNEILIETEKIKGIVSDEYHDNIVRRRYYLYNVFTNKWREIGLEGWKENGMVRGHCVLSKKNELLHFKLANFCSKRREKLIDNILFCSSTKLSIISATESITSFRIWSLPAGSSKPISIQRDRMLSLPFSLPLWIPSNFQCNDCCIHPGPKFSCETFSYNFSITYCYRLQSKESDLFIFFYEDCRKIFVLDLRSVGLWMTTQIDLCSRHHPSVKLIDIGIENDIVYFLKHETRWIEPEDLSEIYGFDLHTWRWNKYTTDVSNIERSTYLDMKSLKRTKNKAYFSASKEYGCGNCCDFVILCLKEMIWFRHYFIFYFDPDLFTRYSFMEECIYDRTHFLDLREDHYPDLYDRKAFFGFMSDHDEIFIFARKNKLPCLLWKASNVSSLRNLALKSCFKTVFDKTISITEICSTASLPKLLLERYL